MSFIDIYNLHSEINQIAKSVVPNDWDANTSTFIEGASNYKTVWTKDNKEKGYLIVEPDSFANTMYLIDFYVFESNNQVFKNLCVEMPPFIRSIGITTFTVPTAATEASQYILNQAGFIKGEDGLWRADISEAGTNSVETYGKLR